MLFDYKCTEEGCDFKDEYSTSPSVPKDMNPPDICPKCGKGKLEIVPDYTHGSFDPGINSYEYLYGKKAWKKNMSTEHAAEVLEGTRDPY